MAADGPTRHRTRVLRTTAEELRSEIGPQLDAFERDYHVTSERMDDAFDGDCADESLAQWRSLYTTWLSIGGHHRG